MRTGHPAPPKICRPAEDVVNAAHAVVAVTPVDDAVCLRDNVNAPMPVKAEVRDVAALSVK